MNRFEKRGGISPKARREAAFQASWEELVSRYERLLHGQVRRSMRSAGLAPELPLVEEKVQEVYCRLLRGGAGRLRRLRMWNERQVAGYLSRIAERVVADEWRAMKAVKRGGGVRIASMGCLRRLANSAVDPRGNPEEQVLLAERRRLLLERCRPIAESMLGWEEPGRCLRILRLVLLEGWSSQEVSRAVGGGLSPSAVDSLVFRVRRRLARGGFDLPRRSGMRSLLSSSP